MTKPVRVQFRIWIQRRNSYTQGAVFDSWYGSLFGAGSPYKKAVSKLFKTGKIGAALFDLLSEGVLVKDPQRRMGIEEVMDHEWFHEEDLEYDGTVQVGGARRNLFDAIMSDDDEVQRSVAIQQVARLKAGRGSESEEESPEINFYFDGDADDMTEDTDFAPRPKLGYCSSARPESPTLSTRKRTMSF